MNRRRFLHELRDLAWPAVSLSLALLSIPYVLGHRALQALSRSRLVEVTS